MAALLFSLIPLFLLRSSAQNTGSVSIGATFTAAQNSNPWRSSSGDFAFGFQQLPDNDDLFVLSIWFDKIPNKTLVWYEKDSYPVPRDSTVRLDASEGIVLQDPRRRPLYTSGRLSGPVASGFMNDSGNFVLRTANSTSLWESFNNPTDTILPTQIIDIGGGLISRTTATNLSQGRFYATLNPDGNFWLLTKSVPSNGEFDDTYFNTGTNDSNNATNAGYQLVFDDRALLYILRRNGRQFTLSSPSNPPSSDNYYRVSLDYDGILAQYYYPRDGSNPGWQMAFSRPDNICQNNDGEKGSGACGYNSVCRLEDRRPVCECPRGFSLVDPGNNLGDCNPNYMPSCVEEEQPEEGYELINISNTDWPKNDYQQIQPSTEDECYNQCLNDCFCGVAIFRNGSCWKKRLPLSNGRVDSALRVTAFLKIRKGDASVNPNRPSPSPGGAEGDKKMLVVVISVLLGSSVFVNCLLFAVGCLGFYLIYNKRLQINNQSQSITSGSSLCCFTFKELMQATNGFKEEVGRGSFGIVYKGVVENGSKSVVAVKRLDRVAQDFEKEFKTEVNVIGQTHHKNLVRLIGFCAEGPHRMLVYEYMSNGALSGFLFDDARPNWNLRTQIALGVARGLTYLHYECDTQIIHCDIKPQNILLDDYYNARISDFGLAKILMMNQSRTLTNIRGTKGYLAPEWFRNTQVTAKVDVYSFGVLLLELVTCRKNVNPNLEFTEEENPILIDWVWDCFVERKVDRLVGNDEEALSDRETLERFVMVGIWCVQEDTSTRPTMRKALQMLEGIVEVGVPLCPYPTYASIV